MAFLSLDSRSETKALTSLACFVRWTSELSVGGWKTPCDGWSPPLELKWLATTKTCSPRKVNSPTSGLRLLFQASEVGLMRPGDTERRTPFLPSATAWTPVVESPPGRSTKVTRAGLKR